MNGVIFFFITLITWPMAYAQNTKLVQTEFGGFPTIDQGKGAPVLLLHGFPDSKELWKNQITVLVDAGFRVIAPDLRGYGNAPSPLEKEKYSIPILMNDVIGILDELGVNKAHLVGHDWGAVLSWQLAKYYGHRFNSLTVLSVGFPGNSEWNSMEQRQKSWYFYLFLQEGLAEKTFADYDWEFARKMLASHKQKEAVLSRLMQPKALTTALNWYRGNLQHMLSQEDVDYTPIKVKPEIPIEKIELPVLGIWSDLDFALGEPQMKKSVEHAASFTYKKIEGAGHWMMFDKPDELNSLILNFLNEQEK
jgi:pimeloyl-ACP methyl ester carboxylesterase